MSDYQAWPREALIARIEQLEKERHTSRELQSGLAALTVSRQPEAPKPKAAKRPLDFSQYSKRRIALRFAYLGWDYHGLAYQKTGHRTVEGEILKALHKTKCIETPDPLDCMFSRCGRTDADVSALSQVISLQVRSVVAAEFHGDSSHDSEELDYVRMLNSNLPENIVFYAVCLSPPEEFDARFSCLSRTYRYYFDKRILGVDTALMQEAASRFLGEHDFRNFCKIDGSKQINNFRRTIIRSEIKQSNDSVSSLCYFELQGTAFLWNQVRSMMAILFLVGQGLEKPDVITRLLDVERQPQRPVYEIAWGVPLVLYDCEYPAMAWTVPPFVDVKRLEAQRTQSLMKLAMTDTLLSLVAGKTGQQLYEVKTQAKYVPLSVRQLCEGPEVINAKWLARKESKNVHRST